MHFFCNHTFKRCAVNSDKLTSYSVYCLTFQQVCNIIFTSAPLLQDISGTGLDKCKEQQSLHRIYSCTFVSGFLDRKNTTCSIPAESFRKLRRSQELNNVVEMFCFTILSECFLTQPFSPTVIC